MSEVTTEELLKDLSEAVDESRKRNEILEKKFNGIDKEAMDKSDKDIADISQQLSDMSVQVKAQEGIVKQMEDIKEQQAVLAASVGKKTDDNDKEKVSVRSKNFNLMLRKANYYQSYGEHMDEVAEAILEKDFKYSDEHEKTFLKKDMSVGSNPDGGYLVPPEFGAMITGRVFETSPIRPFATVITTSSSEIQLPLDDQEADSGWVGETSSRPDTDTPQVGLIVIPAHELFAQPKATQKLLDDSGVNIESWLAMKVSTRFARDENKAFVIGDGASKPKGFLTYPAWASAGVYERGKIEQIASGIDGGFDGDSFKTLLGSLKENYQAPAIFGMKRDTWTSVTKLQDSQKRYLFDMISNLRDGDILQLLGKQVVLMNDMPEIANDKLSVVYGDFGEGYTVADRIGIRILRDPYTAKPFIKFYTTKRVGGAVTNYEALKIMILAATF